VGTKGVIWRWLMKVEELACQDIHPLYSTKLRSRLEAAARQYLSSGASIGVRRDRAASHGKWRCVWNGLGFSLRP
jgi:hypothetical protein